MSEPTVCTCGGVMFGDGFAHTTACPSFKGQPDSCSSCSTLRERAEAAEAQRDDARADAGELEAIKALVSDRSEVGCYAKVEAMVTAEALAQRLSAALQTYGQHKQDCWLKFETRNLVPGGEGFGMRFRQPDDGDPVCTCGFDAALTGEPPT